MWPGFVLKTRGVGINQSGHDSSLLCINSGNQKKSAEQKYKHGLYFNGSELIGAAGFDQRKPTTIQLTVGRAMSPNPELQAIL